jgi:hypothetical protein
VPSYNYRRAVSKAAFTQNCKRDKHLLSRIKAIYKQYNTALKMLNTLLTEKDNTNVLLLDIRNKVQKLCCRNLAG